MNGAPVASPTPHHCPLCGSRFADPVTHCRSCPLAGACGTICCPSCGYTYVERSSLVDLLQRLAARLSGRRHGGGVVH